MISPIFQRIQLTDYRVVILRTEQICELDNEHAQRLDKAACSFKRNRRRYGLSCNGGQKRIIAGILKEFGAEAFHRGQVRMWCAFADEDFTEEQISGALGQLSSGENPPVRRVSDECSCAEWQVDRRALASFLG